MKKVKVMRVYERTLEDGSGHDFQIPIVEGFSDWEEISDEEFETLRNATYYIKNKDYRLVIVEPHDLPAKIIIKNEIERFRKQKEQSDKAAKAYQEKQELAKIKKLNKKKEKEEKLLKELAAKHGIKLED